MISIEKIEFNGINDFLKTINNDLIYYSPEYLKFLDRTLRDSKLFYIVFQNNQTIEGIIPISISSLKNNYQIINSLPFYGGHGGVLTKQNTIKIDEIQRKLIGFLSKKLINKKTLSTIIVENPFNPISTKIISKYGFVEEDIRLSQFKVLPSSNDLESIKKILIESYHSKTRNSVRKGLKFNPKIYEKNDLEIISWIHIIHAKSMSKINGKPKTLNELNELLKSFPSPQKSRIYVAEIDNKKVSGLILLLYRNTVEYFMPVIHEDYKSTQILSTLIYYAMSHLSMEGYKIWNWGGTWKSQDGVYRFKERFGSVHKEYRYFSKKKLDLLSKFSPASINKDYNHYYAYNFQSK